MIKDIEVLSDSIHSMAFTQDNQGAYISDCSGNIKMIKWKPNASSEDDFDFSQYLIQLGTKGTYEICLTRDDKNLFVGSYHTLIVFNTKTVKVTKTFNLICHVDGIKLVNNKDVLIAEENGDFSIINLQSLEITQSHKNATIGKTLDKI